MPRLNQDEIVTIHTLKEKKQSNREIARHLGVTEGAVRYQVRKKAEGRPDGREKPRKAEAWSEDIAAWLEPYLEDREREANLKHLHEWLVEEHGYEGSYRSI